MQIIGIEYRKLRIQYRRMRAWTVTMRSSGTSSHPARGGARIAQIASREKTNMSYSISTLLIRNLEDVFGENDPERRRAAIDEIYSEDVVFYDPSNNVYRGRDEIDRIAGAIKVTHPDFSYQPIAEPEELGN